LKKSKNEEEIDNNKSSKEKESYKTKDDIVQDNSKTEKEEETDKLENKIEQNDEIKEQKGESTTETKVEKEEKVEEEKFEVNPLKTDLQNKFEELLRKTKAINEVLEQKDDFDLV